MDNVSGTTREAKQTGDTIPLMPGIPRHPNREQLRAFGDGRSASQDRVWVEAHLLTCIACRKDLAGMGPRRRSGGSTPRRGAWRSPILIIALVLGIAISALLTIPWLGGPRDVEPESALPREAESPPAQAFAPPEPAVQAEPLVAPETGIAEPEPEPELEPPAAAPAELDAAAAVVEAPDEEAVAPEVAEEPVSPSLSPPEAPPAYRPDAALVGGSLAQVRGAPAIRAGVGGELPELRVLAPEHVGATAAGGPTLYWFLGGTSAVPVAIALSADGASQPLLAQRLEPPVAAGLHALPLAQHGIALEPRVSYRWSVALQPDPANREADLVSSAAVRRDDANSAMVATAAPAEHAHALAAAGYWYDAFDELTRRVRQDPEAKRLREHRAALLEQVGLGGIAGRLAAPPEPSAASPAEPGPQ